MGSVVTRTSFFDSIRMATTQKPDDHGRPPTIASHRSAGVAVHARQIRRMALPRRGRQVTTSEADSCTYPARGTWYVGAIEIIHLRTVEEREYHIEGVDLWHQRWRQSVSCGTVYPSPGDSRSKTRATSRGLAKVRQVFSGVSLDVRIAAGFSRGGVNA